MKTRINFDNVLYVGEGSYVPAGQKEFVQTFVFHFIGGDTLKVDQTPQIQMAIDNYFHTTETTNERKAS